MANQLKEDLVLNSSQFDSNINKVIRKVEELKSKGKNVGSGFDSSMGKMIQKATGFNGSLSSLVGILGKFSGALGLAMGAGEAFNKTLHSSQTLSDEFGAIQQSVTTVVDNFFQSLANGDFSPFLNGIDNIVSKAREAYDAMDDLWNMAQSYSVQNARLNNQFQKNLIEIRQKKGSNKSEDKARVAELTKQNQDIIKKQAQGGVKLYNQTIDALQAEIAAGTGMNSRITEGAIYRIVENDINNLKSGRAKYKREYESYQKELDKLNKKADKDFQNGGMGRYGVNYTNEKNALERKYGESIAANYLLQRKSDEELDEFNNKLKQGIQYQGVAIANQSKMVRYTKEMTTAASGGKTSKTSNKTSTKTNYAVGSVGYYENLISDLQKQIKVQVDASEIENLQKKIEDAKEQLELLVNPQIMDLQEIKPLENILDFKLDVEIPTEPIVKDLQTIYKESRDSINNILDAYDMGILGHDKAKEMIDAVNDELKRNKLNPIEVEVIPKAQQDLNKFQSNYSSVIGGFQGIDNVISDIDALSNSLKDGASAWETFIGTLQIGMTVIQAISSVLESVNTITKLFGQTSTTTAGQVAAATATEAAASNANASAKASEAVASATASGAKLVFPYNLAAIAAGISAVVGALALMGTFANGGVIGGNSYSGDRLLARVNSGEAILNQNQQKHLFTLLNGNHSANSLGGNVKFIIQGKDLVGTLNNYNKVNSKLI